LAVSIVLTASCVPRHPSSEQPSPLAAGPSAAPLEVSYDFGSVDQGTLVQHVFHIANRGQQTLEIQSVHGSCGCTAAIVAASSVAPGAETAIEVSLDTHKLVGAHARSVSVHTNDAAQPTLSLTLHGTVVAEVSANPAEVYLGRVAHGSTVSRAIDITVAEQVVINNVKSESGKLVLKTTPLDPPQHGMHVLVILPGSLEPGRFNDRLLVTTSSAKQPTLAVPVLASIESQLAAWPPHLQLGWVGRGAAAGELWLRNRGDRPLEVAGVRATSPALVATVEPVEPGWSYRVRLKVRDDAPRADLDAAVEVLVGDRTTPITVVPVSGKIRG